MRNKERKLCLKLLLILYFLILIYFMFFSKKLGRIINLNTYRYNIIPFREILRFYMYREKLGFKVFLLNILGNILAFMPFGFLVPSLSNKKYGCNKIFIFALFISTFLEILQLLLTVGSFDIDDIILNSFGAILGYSLFRVYSIKKYV